MEPILESSFDVVAAVRMLAARIEALEQRLAEPEEDARQAKPARPPRAKSETLEAQA